MTKKQQSVDHENKVAQKYGGKRSKSSGASIVDKYDVKSFDFLIECKTKGEPGKPVKSTLVDLITKQADSAYETNRTPVVNQRFFMPNNVYADSDGYVYVTSRFTDDDVNLVNGRDDYWA